MVTILFAALSLSTARSLGLVAAAGLALAAGVVSLLRVFENCPGVRSRNG
jgi:hypothetical protein